MKLDENTLLSNLHVILTGCFDREVSNLISAYAGFCSIGSEPGTPNQRAV